jgi:hypothetical protein
MFLIRCAPGVRLRQSKPEWTLSGKSAAYAGED